MSDTAVNRAKDPCRTVRTGSGRVRGLDPATSAGPGKGSAREGPASVRKPSSGTARVFDADPGGRTAEVLLVFLAFLAIYLATRSQYYTGDTLYYAQQVDAWLAEHRKLYMFYHFAHVLVIPIAVAFSLVLESALGLDTLAAMGVMAACFGAGTVAAFHQAARLLGLSRTHALILTAILGFSFGIWDYSTVGEDRMQGLFFCTLFLALFCRTWVRSRQGKPLTLGSGLLTGAALGLSVGTHLSNGILMPFFCLSAVVLFGWRVLGRRYFLAALLTSLALISCFYLLVAFGNENRIESLEHFLKVVFLYHSEEQPYFSRGLGFQEALAQVAKAAIGIFTAFYYMPEAYLRTFLAFSSWPVRVALSGTFFLFLVAFVGVIGSAPVGRMGACLGVLAGLWGLHSFLFEPISRADWLPIQVVVFLLFAGAWQRNPAAAAPGTGDRMHRWARAYLPVFLLSLVVNNGPHMLAFHLERNPYLRFIDFCRERLPEGSILIEGNPMALSHFDYFQDRLHYPFQVVALGDAMGVKPTIFTRLKPPPGMLLEFDTALAAGKPVFITRRSLQLPPEYERYLELVYTRKDIEGFLGKYRIEPFLENPYSDILRVERRSPAPPAPGGSG